MSEGDAQHDHPISTLAASGRDTAFNGGKLRYCRTGVTHFLLIGGKAWPVLTQKRSDRCQKVQDAGCSAAGFLGCPGLAAAWVGCFAATRMTSTSDYQSACWPLPCGDGRVEPYEPHRVCFIEFGDRFP